MPGDPSLPFGQNAADSEIEGNQRCPEVDPALAPADPQNLDRQARWTASVIRSSSCALSWPIRGQTTPRRIRAAIALLPFMHVKAATKPAAEPTGKPAATVTRFPPAPAPTRSH